MGGLGERKRGGDVDASTEELVASWRRVTFVEMTSARERAPPVVVADTETGTHSITLFSLTHARNAPCQ